MHMIFDDEFACDLSYSVITRMTLKYESSFPAEKAPNSQRVNQKPFAVLLMGRKKPKGQSMKSISQNIVSQSNIINIWYIQTSIRPHITE